MKLDTPFRSLAILLGVLLTLFLVYTHISYFGDVSLLSRLVLLEIVVACLWKYDQLFFPLLMVTFLFAGTDFSLRSAATSGRWAVLALGAVVGFVIWIKNPRRHFDAFHLIAFFCVSFAFVSATVSPLLEMAMAKALSLLLLFLYGCGGARLAVVGRESRFFKGLQWGCEIVIYATTICYFVLGIGIWGNNNSLGAAMSIGIFPILLWGWFTSEVGAVQWRRLAALLLCTYLVYLSHARAGMLAVMSVTLVFCFGVRQYKFLLVGAGMVLFLIGVMGIVTPAAVVQSFGDFEDAILYKGNKEQGMLDSRRTPWEKSVDSIKQHPFFGTGYGTTVTGEDSVAGVGRFVSTAETSREHGSSYVTITEWVGLLGVLPFAVLLGLTAFNVARVCVWLRKTANPYHYSVPLAMVSLAGLMHAGFEDWLFAVGSYLSVYFWFVNFVLVDHIPAGAEVPLRRTVPGAAPRPAGAGLGVLAPGR